MSFLSFSPIYNFRGMHRRVRIPSEERLLKSYLLLLVQTPNLEGRQQKRVHCINASDYLQKFVTVTGFVVLSSPLLGKNLPTTLSSKIIESIVDNKSIPLQLNEDQVILLYGKLWNYGFHSTGLFLSSM